MRAENLVEVLAYSISVFGWWGYTAVMIALKHCLKLRDVQSGWMQFIASGEDTHTLEIVYEALQTKMQDTKSCTKLIHYN